MTGSLTAVMAHEHMADLTRAAAAHRRARSATVPSSAPTVELRVAHAGDEAVLRQLATLDAARPLEGTALLAVVDGIAVAALSLHDGRVVADPFVPTAHAVELLRVRAASLSAVRPRRWRVRLPRLRLA